MELIPIEVGELVKGDVITAERIEAAYGVSRLSADYRLRAMKLCEEIEARTSMLARVDGDNVRVLLDDEADSWAYGNLMAGVRKIRRNDRRLRDCIDTSRLTDQSAHEHRQRVASALRQSLDSELEKQARNARWFPPTSEAQDESGDDEEEDGEPDELAAE